MEGPRPVRSDEMPLLSRLVDAVLMPGQSGGMFEAFPTLFHENNRANLLVFSENGTPLSHVGMVQRWASIGGCTVRVGLIGSVCTYPEHRGRGYASRLFKAACDKAVADGVDFLMISGDRPLYLGSGAAFVGRDREARLNAGAAAALADPRVTLHRFTEDLLPLCAAAYATRSTHYFRTPEDWRAFIDGRFRRGTADLHAIRRDGVFVGYLVHSAQGEGVRRIEEWAGEGDAVAAALARVAEETGAAELSLHLQPFDALPAARLEAVRAEVRPAPTSGTLLILRFGPLMERLRPAFESVLGAEAARALSFEEDGDRFHIRWGQERHEVEGRAALARLVFGHPDTATPAGILGKLFPMPPPWYGLNFI